MTSQDMESQSLAIRNELDDQYMVEMNKMQSTET